MSLSALTFVYYGILSLFSSSSSLETTNAFIYGHPSSEVEISRSGAWGERRTQSMLNEEYKTFFETCVHPKTPVNSSWPKPDFYLPRYWLHITHVTGPWDLQEPATTPRGKAILARTLRTAKGDIQTIMKSHPDSRLALQSPGWHPLSVGIIGPVDVPVFWVDDRFTLLNGDYKIFDHMLKSARRHGSDPIAWRHQFIKTKSVFGGGDEYPPEMFYWVMATPGPYNHTGPANQEQLYDPFDTAQSNQYNILHDFQSIHIKFEADVCTNEYWTVWSWAKRQPFLKECANMLDARIRTLHQKVFPNIRLHHPMAETIKGLIDFTNDIYIGYRHSTPMFWYFPGVLYTMDFPYWADQKIDFKQFNKEFKLLGGMISVTRAFPHQVGGVLSNVYRISSSRIPGQNNKKKRGVRIVCPIQTLSCEYAALYLLK